MKKIYVLALLSCLLMLSACDSYLDIRPVGSVIPQTAEEYRALLARAYLNVPNDRGLACLRSDEMLVNDNEYDRNSYGDIELHFDRKAPHGLCLIYSDDDIELSITAEQEETLQPITNTEPVDNEFFLRDGAVYFSGLYENGLLKEVY